VVTLFITVKWAPSGKINFNVVVMEPAVTFGSPNCSIDGTPFLFLIIAKSLFAFFAINVASISSLSFFAFSAAYDLINSVGLILTKRVFAFFCQNTYLRFHNQTIS